MQGRVSDGSSHVGDPAIPQLSRLLRAAEASSLLEALLAVAPPRPWAARGGEGPLEVQHVVVLRSHPGSRWTLRYIVRPRGGKGAASTVIAKVYARDRGDVAAVLSALRDRDFGAGRPMQANAPIAYLPQLRTLLLEEAPGETARSALRRGVGGVGERVARWLAAFHAASAPLPATYHLRDPLTKARHWARALDARAPTALCREVRRLLALLAQAQPPWPPASPRLVHGDFGASHLYFTTETTTVIDWDAWRVGDGAEDAGRFLASLHRMAARDAGRRGAAEREALAFAQAYRTADPAGGHGLAFYEALACLREAARLAKRGDRRRTRHAGRLLAAAASAVAGDHWRA